MENDDNIKKLYTFTVRPGIDDHYYIRILEGMFVGTIFRYHTIKLIMPENEKDSPKVNFSFEIAESPNFNASHLEKNENFHKLLGKILDNILFDSVNEKTRSLEKTNE